MLDYDSALRVLRDKQIMRPEEVADAVHLVERVTRAGMITFAVALPQNPYRPRLGLTLGAQA
jgi:hypothetical protein